MQLNLQHLLTYKNIKIISRYESDYPDSKLKPEEALIELLKYVWLCHKHASDKKLNLSDSSLIFTCVIHQEMEDIDNMWHTFLLFTRDYHAFCEEFLGGNYFHHDPISTKEINIDIASYEIELNRYLSYIYDNLGEDTVMKWFQHI